MRTNPKTCCQRIAIWTLRWGLVSWLTMCGAYAQDGSSSQFTITPLKLPGAHGLVTLDYFAYDATTHNLWVPAANTGSVDVIDTKTNQIRRVKGFSVGKLMLKGKLRTVGPSSIAIGEGAVYVGSRADSRICAVDSRSLKHHGCIAFAPASAGLAAAPDGLIYISATHELWATSGAPPIGVPAADKSIQILSAAAGSQPKPAGKISLSGSAEGYAVDNLHGRFYTNLEESGQTLAIDVRKREILSTWKSCDDPSGVAVDSKRGFVFVACVNHVIVLDGGHEGRVTGSISTGAGVDNIDYSEEDALLYVAAAEAGQLTIARVDDSGKPSPVAVVKTTQGTRSVVAGSNRTAFLIDPLGGNILKVEPKSGARP